MRDARVEARASFERGVTAAREGRWSEAREEFTRSHALVPSAITQLNLAGSQVNSGQLVEGHATYRKLLERPAEAAAHLTEVQRMLRELEARLPTLRFVPSARAPDQLLVLDGRSLGASEGADGLHVNPGAHRVELARSGQPLVRHDFTLAEGQTVVIDLDRLAGESAAASAHVPQGGPLSEPAAALPDPRASRDLTAAPRSSRARRLGRVALGSGAAGLVVLAVAGPIALKADHALSTGCGEHSACSEHDVQHADRLALTADLGLGLALGSAVVGGVAWLVARKRTSAGEHLSIVAHATRHAAGLTTQVPF
jgi:hypothetical protein